MYTKKNTSVTEGAFHIKPQTKYYAIGIAAVTFGQSSFSLPVKVKV